MSGHKFLKRSCDNLKRLLPASKVGHNGGGQKHASVELAANGKAVIVTELHNLSTARLEPAECGRDAAEAAHLFDLPLVSVVIVNYNYAQFLGEAVRSVFSQTYSNIEIVIVDDASTDASGDVLEEIGRSRPDVKIVRREKNGGQSLATRTGFEASSGEYIVFLDSDDVLLPHFVETHVFVHLSLRIPVGLTTSDMVQASRQRIATGTLQYFSAYVKSGTGKAPEMLRRVDVHAPDLWPNPLSNGDISDHIYWIAPTNRTWVWAPTSGNCFRREAVALVINNEELKELRSCTDEYLIRGIAALTGSVLIDRPLSIYRLHGENAFTQMAHLNGTLSYDASKAANTNQKARRMVINHFVGESAMFGRRVSSPFVLLAALRTLDSAWPRMPSNVMGCRTYTGAQVMRHFPAMTAALGYGPLFIYSFRLGISPWRFLLGVVQTFMPFGRRRPAPALGAKDPSESQS
jgi:glycosyltransferase involved in cell wall biosynthesis